MKQEKIETPENNKEFAFKLITGAAFIISWLVLIGMKIYNKEIVLRNYLIVSIILTIIFLIAMFSKKMSEMMNRLKNKESESEPEPISEKEIEKIEKDKIYELWNYSQKGKVLKSKPHNINSSSIYERRHRLYREVEIDGKKTNEIIILINATFPKLMTAILPADCSNIELKDAINRMSKNPYNPDTEEIEISTDNFNRPIQKIKKVSYSQQEKKEGEAVV